MLNLPVVTVGSQVIAANFLLLEHPASNLSSLLQSQLVLAIRQGDHLDYNN
jgi:hypothetical protein